MLNSSININGELTVGSVIPRKNPHGVSVSLPKLTDVVAYEEANPILLALLKGGYPRFVFHKCCLELCRRNQNHAPKGHDLLMFPSDRVAKECIKFIGHGQVVDIEKGGVTLAVFPREHTARAKEYWQHTGQIISSRWAEDILEGRLSPNSSRVIHDLRARVGELQNAAPHDVYVMPTGMAAIFEMHQAVTAKAKAKTIQLGFPYLDTLKIQEKFGEGVIYVPYNSPADLVCLRNRIEENNVSAVFCEIPGNPLLKTIDLKEVKAILQPHGIPLIIDDALGLGNVDISHYADAIVTSLTKYFVGTGDAMGGSVVLNPRSPHYKRFKQHLDDSESLLYARDAEILLQGSQNFEARMKHVNSSTLALVKFLRSHPAIDSINYTDQDPAYRHILKQGGGYGGLLSFTLQDPTLLAEFYDNLNLLKGPSLGMNETLVCLYTFLVHYHEFEEAAKSAVPPHLIRVSVGLENPSEIISAFETALDRASSIRNPTRVFFPYHTNGRPKTVVIERAPQ